MTENEILDVAVEVFKTLCHDVEMKDLSFTIDTIDDFESNLIEWDSESCGNNDVCMWFEFGDLITKSGLTYDYLTVIDFGEKRVALYGDYPPGYWDD